MANNKPKVVKVTMISKKDPFCIVQILWHCPNGDKSQIKPEFYRIHLDADANYPPHGILVEGVLEDESPGYFLQTFTQQYTGTGNRPLALPPNNNLGNRTAKVFFSPNRSDNPTPADGGETIPSINSENGSADFVYISAND